MTKATVLESTSSARPRAGAERRASAAGERVRRTILDAAEQLFAERGFYGTSVRDVTGAAGVRLAAVNYHFGTKEGLFRSVLLRRADVLSAERLLLLQRLSHDGPALARVRAIVQAFVTPVLTRALAKDQGFRSYFALVAQVAGSKLSALELVADQFNRVALEFVLALGAVFPHAPRHRLHHAYQLMLSATLYAFAGNGRLESLTGGALRSDDYARITEDLLSFSAAGMVALCAQPAAPQPEAAQAARAQARKSARRAGRPAPARKKRKGLSER